MSDPDKYPGPCPVCQGEEYIQSIFPCHGPFVPCWLCQDDDPFYTDDEDLRYHAEVGSTD